MNNDLTFFTNEHHDSLLDRFKTTLKDTAYFDILVGYFRTSGFFRLYESFEDIKKIRILVGLNVDKRTIEIIEESRNKNKLDFNSHKRVKDNISKKFVNEMNNSNDNYDIEKGIRKFIEFLQSGKIEMRAYKKANLHAKVYIERFNEDDRDFGNVITGSSNFSESGLFGNREFNVQLKNSVDVKYALDKFEDLWENAVDISEIYVDTIRKRTWLNKQITPYELYLKFLYEYFKEDLNMEEELEIFLPEGYKELKYQKQAVLAAKKILEAFNGVFISDVVGLGKTFVSALLAQQLPGKKLVIVPPALIEYWEDTFFEFGVRGYKVESLGKLDHIIKDYGTEYFDYVFVDEAHKFRNEETQRYEKLHQICFDKKVILVTATPLNNKINDIYSQLKLFQIPRKSDIPGVPNLKAFFDRLRRRLNQYEKDDPEYTKVAKEIYEKARDEVLRYVMIRRTRTEIMKYYNQDLKKQGLSFPELANPMRIIYEFDENTNYAFEKTIEKLPNLNYARYTPLLYLKEDLSEFEKQSQRNVGGFMKVLLVKRLESSFYAFKKTLTRFIESYKNFIDMYKEGTVYISKDIEVYDLLDEDNEEKLLQYVEEEKVQKYSAEEFKEELLTDLYKDINLLKEIKQKWNEVNNDPKIEHFIEELQENKLIKDKKIIIFTESTETGEHLYNNLKKYFKDEVMMFSSSGGKFKGEDRGKQTSKELIKENYDPNNRVQKDDINILITTDVLSEGINLHRSNIVINYDLPWNPTKVLQRVGRVNRVGTSHDKVYVFNFFPTDQSNDQIGLEASIKEKIQAFHDVLGEDAKYLTEEEEVSTHEFFGEKVYRDLNNKENFQDEEEGESELKYLRMIEEVKEEKPDLYKKIKQLPKKARSCKNYKLDNKDSVITFFRKGKLKKNYISNTKLTKDLGFLEASKLFECGPDTERKSEKDLQEYYNLLNKNKEEFSTGLLEEETTRRRGLSNESYIMMRLRAKEMRYNEKFTDKNKDFIEKALVAFQYGIIPRNISKRIKNKIENIFDANKTLNIIKEEIPDSLLKKDFFEDSLKEAKKEIILSEYLLGDKENE